MELEKSGNLTLAEIKRWMLEVGFITNMQAKDSTLEEALLLTELGFNGH